MTGAGGWGHGISKGIEERTYRNSRGHLKKKQNFPKCSRKTHAEWVGCNWENLHDLPAPKIFFKFSGVFWGEGADFFKFKSRIYSITVFKNALATYVLGII